MEGKEIEVFAFSLKIDANTMNFQKVRNNTQISDSYKLFFSGYSHDYALATEASQCHHNCLPNDGLL